LHIVICVKSNAHYNGQQASGPSIRLNGQNFNGVSKITIQQY